MFVDLYMLNHTYILGINATWSWHMVFLMSFWIQFASIVLRIFACIFVRDIGLFSFPVMSSSGFVIRIMLASWKEFGRVSFFSVIWKCLRRSSIKCLVNPQVKLSGAGLFYVVRFLINNSISLLIMVCSAFHFHVNSVLIGCVFLEVYLFLLGHPICWYIFFLSDLQSFLFLWCQKYKFESSSSC